jgi:hypothetical protein
MEAGAIQMNQSAPKLERSLSGLDIFIAKVRKMRTLKGTAIYRAVRAVIGEHRGEILPLPDSKVIACL